MTMHGKPTSESFFVLTHDYGLKFDVLFSRGDIEQEVADLNSETFLEIGRAFMNRYEVILIQQSPHYNFIFSVLKENMKNDGNAEIVYEQDMDTTPDLTEDPTPDPTEDPTPDPTEDPSALIISKSSNRKLDMSISSGTTTKESEAYTEGDTGEKILSASTVIRFHGHVVDIPFKTPFIQFDDHILYFDTLVYKNHEQKAMTYCKFMKFRDDHSER